MARESVTEATLLKTLNRRLQENPDCRGAEITRLEEVPGGVPNWGMEDWRDVDQECVRFARRIALEEFKHYDVAWPKA